MGVSRRNLFTFRMHRLGLVLAALIMATPASYASTLTNAFYSTRAVSSNDLTAFVKWTAVMPRYTAAKKQADAECVGNADCQSASWEQLLIDLKGKPVKQQLDAVNSFFNKVPYIEDTDNYGMNDYWQTPYEMMARGGDCEDYAIAKYISLKRLGVSESNMRIMIVQDNNLGGIMHAILVVTLGDTRYLLDNQASTVTTARDVYHYRPIYAINEHHWWAYQ